GGPVRMREPHCESGGRRLSRRAPREGRRMRRLLGRVQADAPSMSIRRPFPLPVRIAGTSSFAPGPTVTTAELVRRVSPPRDAAAVEARSGVATRSFAPRDVTHAELAAAALTEALAVAALPATALERIIFVCSFGGDMAVPATANHVAARLGLAGSCDCFDVNNACMGFLTAFDLAARSIATGSGPVGIAAVELISRFTTPDDPRPFLVLAD